MLLDVNANYTSMQYTWHFYSNGLILKHKHVLYAFANMHPYMNTQPYMFYVIAFQREMVMLHLAAFRYFQNHDNIVILFVRHLHVLCDRRVIINIHMHVREPCT